MTTQIFSLRPPALRSVARAAFVTLTLSISHALFAQDISRPVATADIPFAFSSGAKVLPAGHYTFVRVSENTYALQDAHGATVQYISGHAADSPKNAAGSVIHFHQYGSSYFLEGAWFAASGDGIELTKGKAEREIQVSSKVPAATNVVLALNSGGGSK